MISKIKIIKNNLEVDFSKIKNSYVLLIATTDKININAFCLN